MDEERRGKTCDLNVDEQGAISKKRKKKATTDSFP